MVHFAPWLLLEFVTAASPALACKYFAAQRRVFGF